MSDPIPEDLGGDVTSEVAGKAEAETQASEAPPLDLSDLASSMVARDDIPEGATSKGGEDQRTGPRRHRYLLRLTVWCLLALVCVLVLRGAMQFLESCFETNAILGWAAVVLVCVTAFLLLFVVMREIQGYLRLSSFDFLRDSYERLDSCPEDRELNDMARKSVRKLLAEMEKSEDRELLERTQRLREKMDIADDAREWQEDIERILLDPMDREVQNLIEEEAANVAVGTAISPRGALDAAIVLWRNARLVRCIAATYRVRAGWYGTCLIVRRVLVSVALANVADEAATAVVAPVLANLGFVKAFVGALAEGATNAMLTIRVGAKAQEECRPLRLPAEKRVKMLKSLAYSAKKAVSLGGRLLRPSKKARDEGLQGKGRQG